MLIPTTQQILAAEQVILAKGRTSSLMREVTFVYASALATLLRATANSAYRLGPAVIRALGDTATHEIGHIRAAEETVLRYKGGVPPTGYLIITLENCLRTLLLATTQGYRPPLGWLDGSFDVAGLKLD